MTVIMPSHRCFDDAVEALALAIVEDVDWANEHLRLVHGICLAPEGPEAGRPFAHAWVEHDATLVIQAGILNGEHGYYGCTRREHYKHLRVQVTTTYTLAEAVEKSRESKTSGPWEPTYAALCSASHTIFFQETT